MRSLTFLAELQKLPPRMAIMRYAWRVMNFMQHSRHHRQHLHMQISAFVNLFWTCFERRSTYLEGKGRGATRRRRGEVEGDERGMYVRVCMSGHV